MGSIWRPSNLSASDSHAHGIYPTIFKSQHLRSPRSWERYEDIQITVPQIPTFKGAILGSSNHSASDPNVRGTDLRNFKSYYLVSQRLWEWSEDLQITVPRISKLVGAIRWSLKHKCLRSPPAWERSEDLQITVSRISTLEEAIRGSSNHRSSGPLARGSDCLRIDLVFLAKNKSLTELGLQ